MAAKVITLPKGTVEVMGEAGKPEKRNVFIHLVSQVVEVTPQKTDTETYLAHEIKEKLEKALDAKAVELEESELDWLRKAIDRLRGEGKVIGSAWYDVVVPLREASPAAKKPKT